MLLHTQLLCVLGLATWFVCVSGGGIGRDRTIESPERIFTFDHHKPCHLLTISFGRTNSSNSHDLDLVIVAAELAARGHRITFLANQGSVPFFTTIAEQNNMPETSYDFITYNYSDPVNIPRLLTSNIPLHMLIRDGSAKQALIAQALLSNSSIMTQLSAKNFDAVLCEHMPAFSQVGPKVASALAIPTMAYDGSTFFWDPPPGLPQVETDFDPSDLADSILARTLNTAAWARRQWDAFTGPSSSVWENLRRGFNLPAADVQPGVIARLLSREMEYANPIPHTHTLVGSLTPKPAQPTLPSKIAPFFESAVAEGVPVIYVSFGSMSNYAKMLLPEDYLAMAKAFASMAPAKVLWALSKGSLPQSMEMDDLGVENNTLVLSSWAPQNDILGHPATKAYLTACGIHSVYEAAFHGVPMLGMPFQREQLYNARRVEWMGMGLLIKNAPVLRAKGARAKGASAKPFEIDDIVRDLSDVLINPSHTKALKVVSHAMQAQYKRRRPVQLAADLIENSLQMQAHRMHKSHLTFSQTWEVKLLAAIGMCLLMTVLAVTLLAIAGVRRVFIMLNAQKYWSASFAGGRKKHIRSAEKPKHA